MIRVAINGYGRIGRCILRALEERRQFGGAQEDSQNIVIVAINELADANTVAHLTRYDSTHGRFPGSVDLPSNGETLVINQQSIVLLQQPDISQLPWQELDVDIVLECTGAFVDRATAQRHLDAGAKKVIFSQPAEADVDATIVYGVNHSVLQVEHSIISNSSCTSNAIIPVIRELDEHFGIDYGIIRTLHSAMQDQPVIDAYHHTDLRKTRAAFQSIIPVDTGLAKGIGRIFPHLEGRFEAHAVRVPTINVSAIDVALTLHQDTSIEQVHQRLQEASERLNGILTCTTEPLASCDFNHDSHSCIIDLNQTRMGGKRLLKLFIWFDNEWGYANRMLDTTQYFFNLPKIFQPED